MSSAVCRQCTHWQEPPPDRFRAFASLRGRLPNQTCMHLGQHTGFKDCPTCRGSVKLKVFACHHPAHGSTTLEDCRFCQDFDEPLGLRTVRNWAVGITTAPRTEPTIGRCLASLRRAGFESFRIFAEPKSPIPAECENSPITWRESRVGAWPNWLLCLRNCTCAIPRPMASCSSRTTPCCARTCACTSKTRFGHCQDSATCRSTTRLMRRTSGPAGSR